MQIEQEPQKKKRTTPVAAKYLCGESPRTRGEKKRRRILDWVYRWGFSSAEIIRRLSGQQAKGYAAGLVKKGWLTETKTKSGNPRFIYTLSETGRQEAEYFSEKLYRYPEADPYRVNQAQLRHYLLAQQVTVNALTNGSILGYETERMLLKEAGDQAGKKRPDVVWILATGHKLGIEIELSAKWARQMDDFILGLMRAIRPESLLQPASYSSFLIFTDSPGIFHRYKELVSPGSEVRLWKKNTRDHWEAVETYAIPSWLEERVHFHLIERNDVIPTESLTQQMLETLVSRPTPDAPIRKARVALKTFCVFAKGYLQSTVQTQTEQQARELVFLNGGYKSLNELEALEIGELWRSKAVRNDAEDGTFIKYYDFHFFAYFDDHNWGLFPENDPAAIEAAAEVLGVDPAQFWQIVTPVLDEIADW
jgi:hypothetical protein